MALAETISNNFLPIFYSVVVIIILIIIAKVIHTRERTQERKELAELRLKHKKLDIQRKQKHIDRRFQSSPLL